MGQNMKKKTTIFEKYFLFLKPKKIKKISYINVVYYLKKIYKYIFLYTVFEISRKLVFF